MVVLDAHRAGYASGATAGRSAWASASIRTASSWSGWIIEACIGVEALALVRALIDEHAIPADYKPGLLHTNHARALRR